MVFDIFHSVRNYNNLRQFRSNPKMQEQVSFNQVRRALTNSQLETTKRIGKLEARLADLDTNLTDPTVRCKERKKLRFTRGMIVGRIDTERHNLVAITNALTDTDLRIQSGQQTPGAAGYVLPLLHLANVQSPPPSPFMPFPMSPLLSPVSPSPHTSYFPQHPWTGQYVPHSPVAGQESFDHGDTPVSPGYWLSSPFYEPGYFGPFSPPHSQGTPSLNEQQENSGFCKINTDVETSKDKETKTNREVEEAENEMVVNKEVLDSADQKLDDSATTLVSQDCSENGRVHIWRNARHHSV
jgi:hypothetical protein